MEAVVAVIEHGGPGSPHSRGRRRVAARRSGSWKRSAAAAGFAAATAVAALGFAVPLAYGQGAPSDAGSAVARADGQSPRPGDVVRLQVWREPDLSGEFPVDADGFVVLPRIGAVQASQLSTDALKQLLVDSYAVYLNHAAIDVEVLRRVQVLGEVRNPGVYTLAPTMTVADALAVAGGRTGQGHSHRLDLIRDGERVAVNLSPEERIGDSPIRSGDQLYVPERSWWARHSAIVSSAITASASLLIALIL